ncbi:hypothetical protein [Bacteroides helcogenes]|uniref:Uncharacterized protein n=1 Tax=Bacteroides helcogenes (strain ATCC 35417 / DSM 20613 / JCM 6297 / CCUG 15421 / P 36-108) TaxID=693979 RepID=E6SS11_BACT6|nr:hypothetical protein [Bacteroides helcogenes]ADV43113.1 hypothetical protein Bache_1103 [Bacteroides helcogenes P 36-108]MDY5239091.1 hypothetical protein [Bacteroides helcogenes]
MKTTVKTFWFCMLLMLAYSISGKAIDFTQTNMKHSNVAEVSASLSSCSSYALSNINKSSSIYADIKLIGVSDVELGSKPISETYSFNQQRLRRIIEDNLFLRNILLILSNHEAHLVQSLTKLYYSDKDPNYALAGCDYYIYTLRRILI